MSSPTLTVNTTIISSGCNRTNSSVDWGRNDLVAYGTCNSVALYKMKTTDVTSAAVVGILVGHNKRVNCVKWIRHSDREPETELVSGSVDNTAIVWTQTAPQSSSFERRHTLKGHTGAVTSVDGLHTTNNMVVIATASADFSVKIWQRSDRDFHDIQTISYGNGFALSVSFTPVPHSQGGILLACGVTDHKVHLYSWSTQQEFVPVMKLGGHEDWVRSVAFTISGFGDILLASAGQDHMIRVWRITSPDTATNKSAADSSDVPGDGIANDLPSEVDIKLREQAFSMCCQGGRCRYIVILETVLSGHENWVYSVCWQPSSHVDGECLEEMSLLSASMDKTMIVWRPDRDTGVWIDQVRVGEVGGNTLGFYGGLFGPTGDSILAHGYQGAFHQWKFSKDLTDCKPVVTIKGHFDGVVDVAWDVDGQYLVTASLDQTTRLYAPWILNGQCMGWYEIARPQIHGYDMHCLAVLNRFCFASGADEKVIRIFEAPTNFTRNLCRICGVTVSEDLVDHSKASRSQPEGASVPALGLSNKAVFAEQEPDLKGDLDKMTVPEQLSELSFTSVTLIEPPTEEHLLQNTLWPETHKLYSHSYEIYSLAANPQGSILASASKATKPEYARIVMWDTQSWRPLCTLAGPSLTVTQLAFSHCGTYLLGVSRDRTWHLYHSLQHGEWSLVANIEKKTSVHGRIIWSGCWSHDDVYFATASRDKKVVMWERDCQGRDTVSNTPCGAVLTTHESATAVDMAPTLIHNQYIVAVGLESGTVTLHSWRPNPPSWQTLYTLDNGSAHALTVKRLKFRPLQGRAEDRGEREVADAGVTLQLASCGSDHAVRLYELSCASADKS